MNFMEFKLYDMLKVRYDISMTVELKHNNEESLFDYLKQYIHDTYKDNAKFLMYEGIKDRNVMVTMICDNNDYSFYFNMHRNKQLVKQLEKIDKVFLKNETIDTFKYFFQDIKLAQNIKEYSPKYFIVDYLNKNVVFYENWHPIFVIEWYRFKEFKNCLTKNYIRMKLLMDKI